MASRTEFSASPKRCAHRCRGGLSFRKYYGHAFQAGSTWHVKDKAIKHADIKPASPQLNGKVERSHRPDQEEFYQFLTYKDDIDLEANLDEWKRFYDVSEASWCLQCWQANKRRNRPPPSHLVRCGQWIVHKVPFYRDPLD